MSSTTSRGRLDQISIGLSLLCAVHCLVLPVLAGLLPVLTAWSGGDVHFHAVMLILVVPLSGLALGRGWLHHRDIAVLLLGVAGVMIMALAALTGHEFLNESGERLASLFGSILLAAGHLRNYRRCRASDGCHQTAC